MRVPASQTIILKPELIRLVRRGDSRKWQAHYKLDKVKTWFRVTTDTANVKEAGMIAERLWMKATFDFEAGRPVISRRFKPVAEVVLYRLEAEIAAGTAKPSARDYVSAIRLCTDSVSGDAYPARRQQYQDFTRAGAREAAPHPAPEGQGQ